LKIKNKGEKMKKGKCCPHGGSMLCLPIIILVIAVLWLLADLGVIALSVPWFPVILIVISLKWIVHSYMMDK
jgi:hypothetical protein